jgi:RimJ/RimL family protein N-acetyltransferase
MKGKSTDNNEEPIFNIAGDLVALGPLRRDLLPLYQRWINDLGTMRTLGLAPLPMTSEKEQDWYERQSKTEDDTPFTIYERETLRPIGNTGLHGVDHRNRAATFGILIGEPECRGKGYGTETTRLMLDYAFTALGLHNVMLTVFEFNPAGTRFAPHPQVQRPAPRHPPGRIEAAHEARKPGRIEVLPLPEVAVVEADHNKH